MLIVGGSSGIGLALVTTLATAGSEAILAGRSARRLAEAVEALAGLPGPVRAAVADMGVADDVARLCAEAGPLDHVVATAADVSTAYGPVAAFDPDRARGLVDSKLIGSLLLARHAAPHLAPTGSITFTSGIAAYRPSAGGALVAGVNGALASIAAALAVELAPIRVNAVSPGWVDTPIWDVLAGAARPQTLDEMGRRLPAGRVGQPADIAAAYLAVMRNPFITGTVVHVDGGQRLV
ncbi:SDR family oxidoreductase [Frankia sp. QA3]|uniref:SDR family oxidoreductase n=1 Tax=Frankia sp. QA3 TaxID=710111 RepID=UPI0005695960|nr:SDR family oxidoreductase [Frankia sp. QA3]